MRGAAAGAVLATLVLWAAAVGWPAGAGILREGGGSVPESFQGNQVLATTLGWAVGIALAAAVPGWIAGRAIRSSRMGGVVLASSVMAVALPAYAVFWAWWQAAGPGSSLGDWAARTDHAGALRLSLLTLGLVSWCWPLTAWCVAARADPAQDAVGQLHTLDGARWPARLAYAWHADWPAIALGTGITAFVVAGTTIAFDLAQVNTFGFELRTLHSQGTPAGALFRAALPAMGIAAAGAVALAALPRRRAWDLAAPPRASAGWCAMAVVAVTLVAPLAVLVWALVGTGAMGTFGPVAQRGAAGTLAAAGTAGALCGAVAVGHLALTARGDSQDRAARAWRWVERCLLAGWLLAALVPGTVYALAMTLAYNSKGLGPWIYDTPAVIVLAEVGRFGAAAAWIGRVVARAEPEERRWLRLAEAEGWRGMLGAMAPQAWAAAGAASLLVAALAAGEVVVTAPLEPPGWEWAAGQLLNAIHYQQPDAALGTLLALAALALAAGVTLALAAARVRRMVGAHHACVGFLLVPAAAALLFCTGCRKEPEASGAAGALQVVRWFGASGRGPGVFEYPRALEIDPRDGSVLVIDRQARVHRFSKEGKFVGGWQMPDYAKGKPTGFCVATDGTVWVADTHYHRVIVFTPQGQEIRRWGEYGMEPGEFIFPCDVAMGPDGLVYVAEFGSNDRIQVFTPEGKFVRVIGSHGRGTGQFDRPQAIEFASSGELFVADACNHRIQVLDAAGKVVRVLGGVGSAPGQFVYPYGMRLLPDGTMLVSEFGGHRVQRLDQQTGAALSGWHLVSGCPPPATAFVIDGDGVRPIPSSGNDLRIPWAVGWRDGEMFVLDSGHARVLVAKAPLLGSQ